MPASVTIPSAGAVAAGRFPFPSACSTRIPAAICACVLLAVTATAVAAGVLELPAARDNTLFEDAAGALSDGAGPVFFVGRTSVGNTRRGVLAFDLTDPALATARIDSVVLHLHVSNVSDPQSRFVHLHRLMADWGEGASSTSSGSGAPAEPNDATWLHTYYATAFWTTAGGDYADVASDSFIVDGVDWYAWSGDGLRDDVRAWIAAPAGNHGWLLRGDESAVTTARRFDSRENPTAANRPSLTVYYSPATASRPASWGTVKSLFR